MTQEEKAKAYDEAIERAKAMIKVAANQDETICFTNTIFPELKESEDEKIRKALIKYCKLQQKANNIGLCGISLIEIIAWLEKQGNNLVENGYTDNKDIIKYADNYSHEIWHKLMNNFENIKDYHIGCNDVSDIVLNAIIDAYNWLEKQGTSYTKRDVDDAFVEGMAFAKDELEKQGEQKPLDYENANIQQKDFAPKATTANRQVYNRAILKILSDYVEKYPDIRFGQMLCNLDIKPHFDEESRETYCNLNETINKSKDESKN